MTLSVSFPSFYVVLIIFDLIIQSSICLYCVVMEQFDPILSYGELVEDDKNKFARGHKALKVNLSDFLNFGRKILVTKM